MDEPKKKLLNQLGIIRKGEQCPFHEKCPHVDSTCRLGHKIAETDVSCAMARMFEMFEK